MNKESALKHLEMYLRKTHDLYCNQGGLQYSDKYISDEVERDNNPRSIPEMRAAWRTSGGFEFGGFYTASEVDYLTQEAGQ